MGPRASLDRRGKSRPTGIRFPDRPARSQSLYRLSYPTHNFVRLLVKIQVEEHNKLSNYVYLSLMKVIPKRGNEGTEGEYRYSSSLSLTSALDTGGWSTPRPGYIILGKNLAPNRIRSPDRPARSKSLY